MGHVLVAAFLDLFDISNSGSKAKPMAMPIVPEKLKAIPDQEASMSSSG
jgi:hypothetical protein